MSYISVEVFRPAIDQTVVFWADADVSEELALSIIRLEMSLRIRFFLRTHLKMIAVDIIQEGRKQLRVLMTQTSVPFWFGTSIPS
jgi:hypothetical protein